MSSMIMIIVMMRSVIVRALALAKDASGTPFAELQRLPPPHALAGDELRRRFACVRYDVGQGPVEYVGVVLPDPFERERFYACMKILAWAVEARRGRA